MPIVILRSLVDKVLNLECEFAGELKIGADSGNDLCLITQEHSVASFHAVIVRANAYQVPVLVNLAGNTGTTMVNSRPVIRLKVLRHNDRIQLGGAALEYWELVLRTVTSDSPYTGKICPVCYVAIRLGDQIIVCPRCQVAHHKQCWFYLSTCSTYACSYPAQETLRRVMAPYVRFEKLEEEHKFVKEKQQCLAGAERDRVPFQGDEIIAMCPKCGKPYHIDCWLHLDTCPNCGHDIQALLQSVFSPVPAISAGVEVGV